MTTRSAVAVSEAVRLLEAGVSPHPVETLTGVSVAWPPPRPLPPHGTLTRYRHHTYPCRHRCCRDANSRYLKHYWHDRRGGVARMVPVGETSQLVRQLLKVYGWRRTAEITGCGPRQLLRLRNRTYVRVSVSIAARVAEAADFYLATPDRSHVIDEVAVERALHGDRVPLTRAERRTAAARLVGRLPDGQVAERIGVTRRTVVRYRQSERRSA